MAKYIFITGGVVSGLGKGLTAASLGRILKQRGLKVYMQKLDPYINIDPGTMSPYQHGEVFVTTDGAETDLDLGHYERFIDQRLPTDFFEYQNACSFMHCFYLSYKLLYQLRRFCHQLYNHRLFHVCVDYHQL